MPYFKLRDGVYFVKGAKRGAILDTDTEFVFSVNKDAVAIIESKTPNEEFWHKLVSMRLAEECAAPCSLPKLPSVSRIDLKFIWFEIITENCNERCIHCYADSMPIISRRSLARTQLVVKPKLTYKKWCQLIIEGRELGCKACQFIGGEPFLYYDDGKTVLDLAELARSVGYERVEIFTNATLLNESKAKRIKDLNLRVAVSLYSHDPSIHDLVTQTPGSHAKTLASLRLLGELSVTTRVEVVAMRHNEITLPETIQLIEDMGFNRSRPDPLRPKGRGDKLSLKPSAETVIRYGVRTEPNFYAQRQTIEHYTSGHSCLAGKITITDSGDVLPCIFSRNHSIGNVAESNSLEQILISNELQQIWKLTKDNVLVCQDCEYRYVCFDCRPLSEAAASGQAGYSTAPYPRCTYNPYTGEWGQGIWRMKDNKPFYDRSCAELIAHTVKASS